MKENYDYSKYTTVCTISICSVAQTLMIHHMSNTILQSPARYDPERYIKIPLDFYYNKNSSSIIYGNRMIRHYKQHPPYEQYVHVSNFVKDLYALYERSCKEEPTTQDDIKLSLAITSFLTKVYPPQLSLCKRASTTQCAFILPSQEYTDKKFIDKTLRPLLQNTPWITLDDSPSKIVFFSEIDTYAYLLNNIFWWKKCCLEREKKYLLCVIQKSSDQRQLVLTANFIRAVYDPDLIAASGRSMTALGKDILFSSKLLSPPLSLEIPIEPASAIMDRLAILLYNKYFAGEDESRPTELDKYNTDSKQESLIHQLIYFILRGTWSKECNADDFSNSTLPDNFIYNVESWKSILTYDEAMQLFGDDCVSFVEREIGDYVQKYGNEELFESIVIGEDEDEDKDEDEEDEGDYYEDGYEEKYTYYVVGKNDDDKNLGFTDTKPYKAHNLVFAEECYQKFYKMRVRQALACFLEQVKESKNTKKLYLRRWGTAEGCAVKISSMVRLSNKFEMPIVVGPAGEIKHEPSKSPVIQKEKLALIDKIQPYGFYVEANMNGSNQIKMYLNQVIETTTEDGRLQKSTMSILDSFCEAPDMYNSIFDAIWSIVDRHRATSQCESPQEDELVNLSRYELIRTEIIYAIKSSMENKSNVIQNLDEVIYHPNANWNYTDNIAITHRFVMDVGLLPYLRCIAVKIVASLKANAIFGHYKISCLLVTGEFLYKWLQQGNSTYGEFIWSQLHQVICSELANKQPHTYLMMKKSIVLDEKALDYQPLKLEMYRQVFSKYYYLEITFGIENKVQLYQDKVDHCLKIPFQSQNKYFSTWRLPLLPNEGEESSRCFHETKFYITGNPDDDDEICLETGVIASSMAELNSVDFSTVNTALTFRFDYLEYSKARFTFPIEFKIMPCSYLSTIKFRSRRGIDASSNDPLDYDQAACPERLTLQRI